MKNSSQLFVIKTDSIKKAIIKIRRNGTRTAVVIDKKKTFTRDTN